VLTSRFTGKKKLADIEWTAWRDGFKSKRAALEAAHEEFGPV